MSVCRSEAAEPARALDLDWEALRWRELEWGALPHTTRKGTIPYLTVREAGRLDCAMTNCEARPHLVKSHYIIIITHPIITKSNPICTISVRHVISIHDATCGTIILHHDQKALSHSSWALPPEDSSSSASPSAPMLAFCSAFLAASAST